MYKLVDETDLIWGENLHWSIKHRICIVLLFDRGSSPQQPPWFPFPNSITSSLITCHMYLILFFLLLPLRAPIPFLLSPFQFHMTFVNVHIHVHTHISTYKLKYTVFLREKTYNIYCSVSNLCFLKWQLQFCLCCCKRCRFIFPHDPVSTSPLSICTMISLSTHQLMSTQAGSNSRVL